MNSDITPNIYKIVTHSYSGLSGSNIGPNPNIIIPASKVEEIQSYTDRFFTSPDSEITYKSFLHGGKIKNDTESTIYFLKNILNAWISTMKSVYHDNSEILDTIENIEKYIDNLKKELDNLEINGKVKNHLFIAALTGLIISNLEYGNKKSKPSFDL